MRIHDGLYRARVKNENDVISTVSILADSEEQARDHMVIGLKEGLEIIDMRKIPKQEQAIVILESMHREAMKRLDVAKVGYENYPKGEMEALELAIEALLNKITRESAEK